MEKEYRTAAQCQQLTKDEVAARRTALFDAYVKPHLRLVYKLCIRYTYDRHDVNDNYTDVLANIYRYIETYDPERSIQTWLHIVTKRYVHDTDERRKRQQDMWNRDYEIDTYADETTGDGASYRSMSLDNYRELYSDDILEALDQLKPQYRRAFLLQQAGYKLREIAEIECENGALESRNIETIKSRLFLARQQLRQLLTRDGNRRVVEEEN